MLLDDDGNHASSKERNSSDCLNKTSAGPELNATGACATAPVTQNRVTSERKTAIVFILANIGLGKFLYGAIDQRFFGGDEPGPMGESNSRC